MAGGGGDGGTAGVGGSIPGGIGLGIGGGGMASSTGPGVPGAGEGGYGPSGGYGISNALASMGIFGDPTGSMVGNQGGGPDDGMRQIQPQQGLFQQPPRPPVTMMNSLFGQPISGLGVPSDLFNHLMKGKY